MGFIDTVVDSTIGAGMGMILGDHNDRRQLRQNEKLQNQQMNAQRKMTDYNYMKQMEMWKATNYQAQIAEMNKAGLNPALMYGMSGGGGTTTGSGGGAGVSGGQAPTGGGEVQALAGMGIQSAMTAAQIEVMKSQAELNRAEAGKKSGIDTEVGKATVLNLTQGVTESKARTALTNVETGIAELKKQIASQTMEEAISMIEWSASKAYRELQIADDAQYVSHATRLTRVDAVRAEYAKIAIDNALTQAQTELAKKGAGKMDVEMRKMEEEIKNWQTQLMQKWAEIGQEGAKIEISKKIQELSAQYPDIWKVAGRVINDGLNVLPRVIQGKEWSKQNK